MVEIGNRPILWHIMKHYSHYGHDDFVVAAGYKAEHIKRWMADSMALEGDLSYDFAAGEIQSLRGDRESWRVVVADTGLDTDIAGRVRRCRDYVEGETFMMTYGDGVSNVDIATLLDYHRSHGCVATLTAVRPLARFGHLDLRDDRVVAFIEKPQLSEGWVNGGFMVFEPDIFDYISGDDSDFGDEVLPALAGDGQLAAFSHDGFWQCMDTIRDKLYLQELWSSGHAPWRTWDG
jgi:glucose-1-phosphate cytidylyltransferase